MNHSLSGWCWTLSLAFMFCGTANAEVVRLACQEQATSKDPRNYTRVIDTSAGTVDGGRAGLLTMTKEKIVYRVYPNAAPRELTMLTEIDRKSGILKGSWPDVPATVAGSCTVF
jgi:hypothetical protein